MGLHYIHLLVGLSSNASQGAALQAGAAHGMQRTHTGGACPETHTCNQTVTVCSFHQLTLRA